MIIVAKPSKPFHYTAKNTARRQAILKDYAEEISRLYETVDETTSSSVPPPAAWDIISTTDFVRTVVNKVLVHQIEDDDDLFENGCDRRAPYLLFQRLESHGNYFVAYKPPGLGTLSSERFVMPPDLIPASPSITLSTTIVQYLVYPISLLTGHLGQLPRALKVEKC